VACGPWKESLDFCGYPDAKIFNGIFTTLANFHTPDGLVIFNEFSLHVRLLAITCFRLQVRPIWCRAFANKSNPPPKEASYGLDIISNGQMDSSSVTLNDP